MPTVRDAPVCAAAPEARERIQPLPSPPQPTPPAAHRPAPSPAHLELVDPQSEKVRRFELNKEVFRLGRDPEGDVVIDAAAAVVSRRHAEIRRAEGQFAIVDLKSFNGTLVNGQRITGTTSLFDKDQIQLGTGGPLLRVIDPGHPAPVRGMEVMRATPQSIPAEFGQIAAMAKRQTIVSSTGSLPPQTLPGAGQSQLLARVAFDNRAQLSVGRAGDNDIRLDGLQISNQDRKSTRLNSSHVAL